MNDTQETIQNEEFTELQEYLKNQGLRERGVPREDKNKFLAEDAVLTNVQSIFYTQNENKDSDTWLECWINLAGEREAAYGSTYGEFNDGQSNILYLGPKSNIMRKGNIPGSWFQVRIRPNGSDTWRFRCEVTMFFSDGTAVSKSFGNTTTLDQDSRQANFYL